MAGVVNKEQAPEEKSQEQKEVKSKADALGDELLDGLDLDTTPEPEEGGKVERVETKKEPEKEEDDEEEEQEEESEDSEEESEEEEEEEVVPRSKLEKERKVNEKLQRRLQAEIAKRKEEEEKPKVSDTRSKLEAMSEPELKKLKRDARNEWKTETDSSRSDQLLDLQDEIDEVLRDAPKRFQKLQVKEFNKAAQEILLDSKNDDIDFTKEANEIKKIAQQIYTSQDYSDLRDLKSGQAIALKQAVDHYRELRKYSKEKVKEKTLKRNVTKLKRKTSLGGSLNKGQAKQGISQKDWNKAKNSWNSEDKERALEGFIDVDRYLPDGYKEG